MAFLMPQMAITAAAAAVISNPVRQFAEEDFVPSVAMIANFNYGSGGTSFTAWVQTTLDGGASWIDVACFAFTTASAKMIASLSALTPVPTILTPTDGTLAADTIVDGIVGLLWRLKSTSVGTYAGGTTFSLNFNRRLRNYGAA